MIAKGKERSKKTREAWDDKVENSFLQARLYRTRRRVRKWSCKLGETAGLIVCVLILVWACCGILTGIKSPLEEKGTDIPKWFSESDSNGFIDNPFLGSGLHITIKFQFPESSLVDRLIRITFPSVCPIELVRDDVSLDPGDIRSFQINYLFCNIVVFCYDGVALLDHRLMVQVWPPLIPMVV